MSKLKDRIHTATINDWLKDYPVTIDFLQNYNLEEIDRNLPFQSALMTLPPEKLDEFGLTPSTATSLFLGFLEAFDVNQCPSSLTTIESLTIIGGQNKFKEAENIHVTVKRGEVVSIVGPTGAGKSRLLGDIECLAQGDTPTGRQILVNNNAPSDEERFEMSGKLVAQLSQNMNFIMDLSVRDFLTMHAKSRFVKNADTLVETCFACANDLAGEKFTIDTKVTQLSGGQSRSLMIADTAYISDSPIVLIDEIENAGIDRRRAIEILAKREKVILISTHDPFLALSANRRIIIKNGGIAKVIETDDLEKASLSTIERLDNLLLDFRQRLRLGELIHIKQEVL